MTPDEFYDFAYSKALDGEIVLLFPAELNGRESLIIKHAKPSVMNRMLLKYPERKVKGAMLARYFVSAKVQTIKSCDRQGIRCKVTL